MSPTVRLSARLCVRLYLYVAVCISVAACTTQDSLYPLFSASDVLHMLLCIRLSVHTLGCASACSCPWLLVSPWPPVPTQDPLFPLKTACTAQFLALRVSACLHLSVHPSGCVSDCTFA